MPDPNDNPNEFRLLDFLRNQSNKRKEPPPTPTDLKDAAKKKDKTKIPGSKVKKALIEAVNEAYGTKLKTTPTRPQNPSSSNQKDESVKPSQTAFANPAELNKASGKTNIATLTRELSNNMNELFKVSSSQLIETRLSNAKLTNIINTVSKIETNTLKTTKILTAIYDDIGEMKYDKNDPRGSVELAKDVVDRKEKSENKEDAPNGGLAEKLTIGRLATAIVTPIVAAIGAVAPPIVAGLAALGIGAAIVKGADAAKGYLNDKVDDLTGRFKTPTTPEEIEAMQRERDKIAGAADAREKGFLGGLDIGGHTKQMRKNVESYDKALKKGGRTLNNASVEVRDVIQDQLEKEAKAQGITLKDSKAGAAAFTGNAYQESGFDPKKIHDNGTGLGMFGHRLDRKDDMIKFAKENNLDPLSREAQARYAAHDAMTNKAYAKTKSAILGADSKNIEETTDLITDDYERPKESAANKPARRAAASKAYYANKIEEDISESGGDGAKPRIGSYEDIKGRANMAKPDSVWGDPADKNFQKDHLSTVKLNDGSTFTVNKHAAEAYKGFFNELLADGYNIKSIAGYNFRNKRWGGGLSQHSYGNAVDVNPEQNKPNSEINDLPADISQRSAKYGLGWGGDWKSRKDGMHFEYSGIVPEGSPLLKQQETPAGSPLTEAQIKEESRRAYVNGRDSFGTAKFFEAQKNKDSVPFFARDENQKIDGEKLNQASTDESIKNDTQKAPVINVPTPPPRPSESNDKKEKNNKEDAPQKSVVNKHSDFYDYYFG